MEVAGYRRIEVVKWRMINECNREKKQRWEGVSTIEIMNETVVLPV